jgi:hypothetical protein
LLRANGLFHDQLENVLDINDRFQDGVKHYDQEKNGQNPGKYVTNSVGTIIGTEITDENEEHPQGNRINNGVLAVHAFHPRR